MHRVSCYLLLLSTSLLLQVGCDTMNTVKVDNPVVGPPPPRVSLTNDIPAGTAYVQNSLDVDDLSSKSPQVMTVSMTENNADWMNDLSPNQVVATVNGSPVFASEILDLYTKPLMQAKKQLPPEEFKKARLQLIQRDLDVHVKRKLLVLALKSTLSKKQLEMIDKQLDIAFEEETDRLQEKLKAGSLIELSEKLNEQGTSLAYLKEAFANTQLAMEYRRAKSNVKQKIGRQEMFNYYQANIKDYSHPAKARWQQISVSFAKHGSQENAFQHLRKAVKELQAGVDFGEVAKKYSDGPEAHRGGKWDWIQQGSLANSLVDSAIFELPVGMPSQVIESKKSYTLVKVTARDEAGAKPFAELQNEIKNKIKEKSFKEASDKLVKELQENATIKTIFDRKS